MAQLTTKEFLSAVRSDGVVISNICYTATKLPYDSIVHTYQQTFGKLHVLRVAGTSNRILFALPRSQPLGRVELADMARKLATTKNFHFHPGSLVERGWIPPDNASFGGKLLTDSNTAANAGK